MKSRREAILEEIGISPRWRLRGDEQNIDQPAMAPHVEFRPASVMDNIKDSSDAVAPTIKQNTQATEILQMNWSQLKACVAACTACPLHTTRTNTVFGVGDENANWLFVGEGPGADEDARGEPFVGQAGKLLDNMLAAIGLKRGNNVYIANIVKCRPPGNRNPEPLEAQQCSPYLQRQIELIKPKVIIALGKVAAQNLLGHDVTIANVRGKRLDYGDATLIVTYHPAYLLRNLPDKAKAWMDLCFARDTMKELEAESVALA